MLSLAQEVGVAYKTKGMPRGPRVNAMGPAVAVLLCLGLVVISSVVFGQGYSGESVGGREVEETFFKDTRMALPATGNLNDQIYEPDSWLRASSLAVQTGRGNKVHKHSRMPSLRVGLKVLLLAVVVPALLAVVLYAAWKGVTLALLSLIISTIIGLKNLFSVYTEPDDGLNKPETLI